jgi:hypothetical protein
MKQKIYFNDNNKINMSTFNIYISHKIHNATQKTSFNKHLRSFRQQ